MKTLLIGAVAACALSMGAVAQAADTPQCFSTYQIRGSRVVDNSTINFLVGKTIFQAKLAPCPGLKSSTRGYSLSAPSGYRICGPVDLDIGVNDIGGGQCVAQSLRALTKAEAAALPAKNRP